MYSQVSGLTKVNKPDLQEILPIFGESETEHDNETDWLVKIVNYESISEIVS